MCLYSWSWLWLYNNCAARQHNKQVLIGKSKLTVKTAIQSIPACRLSSQRIDDYRTAWWPASHSMLPGGGFFLIDPIEWPKSRKLKRLQKTKTTI